jgi:glycosyltransferase involved in cell wall biosynthesis
MLSSIRRGPFLLWGVVLVCIAVAMYLCGVLLVLPRYILGLNAVLLPLNEWIVWYSGVPMTLGLALILVDLFLFFPHKRINASVRQDSFADRRVTVALTAYNDDLSIADAVADFRTHPMVRRVLVVSNNSTDMTLERAHEAGATVFNETSQGYGQCVFRCLSEAVKFDDTELVVLCEGDRTFRASDIEKLLAYAPHADIVNGTRTVERLRQYNTQLSTFMYYGNLFVGKLLEAKHLGVSTLTDVGTTYKLCRRDVLITLLPKLDPRINLEFNAYFMDMALANGFFVIECPITFHARVGVSKGGNVDDLRAFKVGLRMIFGILIGWRRS